MIEKGAKPDVAIDHRVITLSVRPGSTLEKWSVVMQEWQRARLRDAT